MHCQCQFQCLYPHLKINSYFIMLHNQYVQCIVLQLTIRPRSNTNYLWNMSVEMSRICAQNIPKGWSQLSNFGMVFDWNKWTLEQDDKINFNKTPAELNTHEQRWHICSKFVYFSAHILIQNDDWNLYMNATQKKTKLQNCEIFFEEAVVDSSSLSQIYRSNKSSYHDQRYTHVWVE